MTWTKQRQWSLKCFWNKAALCTFSFRLEEVCGSWSAVSHSQISHNISFWQCKNQKQGTKKTLAGTPQKVCWGIRSLVLYWGHRTLEKLATCRWWCCEGTWNTKTWFNQLQGLVEKSRRMWRKGTLIWISQRISDPPFPKRNSCCNPPPKDKLCMLIPPRGGTLWPQEPVVTGDDQAPAWRCSEPPRYVGLQRLPSFAWGGWALFCQVPPVFSCPWTQCIHSNKAY